MGRIGKVLGWVRTVLTGDVTNNPGGGATVRSQLFNDSGVDAPPLDTDYVVSVSVQGSGRTAAVGSVDGVNASTAEPGERRTYARDAEGNIVVTLHMRRDGSARLSNGNGYIELLADGEGRSNGARFTTDGDVITSDNISLRNHTHSQGADSDGDSEVDTDPPNAS